MGVSGAGRAGTGVESVQSCPELRRVGPDWRWTGGPTRGAKRGWWEGPEWSLRKLRHISVELEAPGGWNLRMKTCQLTTQQNAEKACRGL